MTQLDVKTNQTGTRTRGFGLIWTLHRCCSCDADKNCSSNRAIQRKLRTNEDENPVTLRSFVESTALQRIKGFLRLQIT